MTGAPFLDTPETARDLEDLRVALGVDKLTLFGVSYGAKVASEYARRYPDADGGARARLPTPVDGLDGIDELRTLGAPRVLQRGLLPGRLPRDGDRRPRRRSRGRSSACRTALRGPLVRASGRVRTARVTESDLYSLLAASDLNPGCGQGCRPRSRRSPSATRRR